MLHDQVIFCFKCAHVFVQGISPSRTGFLCCFFLFLSCCCRLAAALAVSVNSFIMRRCRPSSLLLLPLQHVASLSSFYASHFPSVCVCVCVPASQYMFLSVCLCVCACFLSICATISLMPLAFCVLPVYFCQLLFVIIFRSFAAF